MDMRIAAVVSALLLTFNAAQDAGAGGFEARSLGHSVSVVGADEVGRLPAADGLPSINLAPGIQIAPAGASGDGTGRVSLRGLGAAGVGEGPLFIIDGVPYDSDRFSVKNPKLDPEFVERIEVLKSAAATSLFGRRAANGVILVTTSPGHRRAALATEVASTLQNPALTLDLDLSGASLGAAANFMLDTGRLLPTELNFGITSHSLSGSGNAAGLTFLEGLGVTGIGGTPGVFVGSPTDLVSGDIEVERTGVELSLDMARAMRLTAFKGGGGFADLYGLGGGRPSVGLTTFYGGLRGGTIEQNEVTQFTMDTPAFGTGSAWAADYQTDFKGNYLGAYIGLGYGRTFARDDGSRMTFGLAGTVGYDTYRFDVSEYVDASGLGGALSYSNAQNHDFREGVFTTDLTASVDITKGNLTYGGFISLGCGRVPEITRHLPDSDLLGALDPEYSLYAAPTRQIGFRVRYDF